MFVFSVQNQSKTWALTDVLSDVRLTVSNANNDVKLSCFKYAENAHKLTLSS